MVKLVRLVQSIKAHIPMLVTLLGIVMLVRLEQATNAIDPMEVTLLGIEILVRLVQPKSAPFSILSTPSGTTMRPFLLPSGHLMSEVSWHVRLRALGSCRAHADVGP